MTTAAPATPTPVTAVEYFFDPACPWTWLTSRWLVDATRQRGVDVTWRSLSLLVLNDGNPPELFKDGAPVVCEGRWDEGLQFFASDDILIKHGAEYTPPSQGIYPSSTTPAP